MSCLPRRGRHGVDPAEAISSSGRRGYFSERPNGVAARVDQAIYRGFVSHYYLKTKSGEKINCFEQNQSQRAGLRYAWRGVIARWDSSSNQYPASLRGSRSR